MSDCKTCNPCRDNSKAEEYLLVKATASQASTCDPSQSTSENANCRKQEDTFDEITTGFILPLANSFANVAVCKASVYSIGQWIQFHNPVSTLQIININNNILTLANRCEDGSPIEANPIAGSTAYNEKARFSVVARPRCSALSEDAEELAAKLAELTQICVPNLAESNVDSDIHPVGRVENDPQDVNFSKCIKRILGIFFRKGVAYFPGIKQTNYASLNSLSRLMINKSDKSIIELPKVSEDTSMLAGKRYLYLYSPNQERLIGPTRVYIAANEVAHNLGTTGGLNDSPAPTFVSASGTPPEIVGDFDLNSAGLNALFNAIQGDYTDFYADFEVYVQLNEGTTNRKNYNMIFNGDRVFRQTGTNRTDSFSFTKRIFFNSRTDQINYTIRQVDTTRPFGASMEVKLVGLYV